MYDYTLLFQITYTKESTYTELFTLLFQILYKRVIYIELFAYLIEKQSIYVRNRYSKNIPKKTLFITQIGLMQTHSKQVCDIIKYTASLK